MANLDQEAPSDDDLPPLLVSQSGQEATEQTDPVVKKVPITIITGYLGAGKTTLLNYILSAQHGKKIAVILNGLYSPISPPFTPFPNCKSHPGATEFGDSADIEKSLTVNKDGREVEEWISLANGCICCSVKDSGVAAIESLMERQGAFDYILLETTGLADPGNIAPIFWVDDGLGSSIYLDGIVTVVDAKNVLRSLDQPTLEESISNLDSPKQVDDAASGQSPRLTTAHLQISHSDILILNKTDLVTQAELEDLIIRIRSINGLAKLITTTHSEVPQLEGTLLDLHAYDSFQTTVERSQPVLPFEAKGSSKIDPSISTRTFPLPTLQPQNLCKLDEWLRKVLWRDGEDENAENVAEVHRTKGLVPLTDGSVRVVQGVREIFDIMEGSTKETGTQGKIVVIGRNLDKLPPPDL